MCRANLEAPVGRNRDSSRQSLATLNYLEIKQIMDRQSTQQKKGKLTDEEIKGLVKDWHDQKREGDLNKTVVNREMKTMEAKLEKYNVDQLGEIPIEREDGTMRIMVVFAAVRRCHRIGPWIVSCHLIYGSYRCKPPLASAYIFSHLLTCTCHKSLSWSR